MISRGAAVGLLDVSSDNCTYRQRINERTNVASRPVCAYPGCDEPVAAPPATGGPAPRYCIREEHTAQTAFRARRARKPAGAAPPESAGPADRPASLAGASLRVTVDRLAELLAEFEAAAGAARSCWGPRRTRKRSPRNSPLSAPRRSRQSRTPRSLWPASSRPGSPPRTPQPRCRPNSNAPARTPQKPGTKRRPRPSRPPSRPGGRRPPTSAPHHFDLAVALGEPHHRDVVLPGEAVDRPAEPGSDPVEQRRGGDRLAEMPRDLDLLLKVVDRTQRALLSIVKFLPGRSTVRRCLRALAPFVPLSRDRHSDHRIRRHGTVRLITRRSPQGAPLGNAPMLT